MTDDPNHGGTRPESRQGRAPDASAARLFAALQSRPGHALVVGDDAATVEALFERVDAQLVCQRRVRLSGAGLDAEAMIHALGAEIRGPHRPRSAEAILSMVATEARAAGLPILVVVSGAEEAGAPALQRLGTLIESVPDARAAVRLVLLGGPRLEEILAQPEADKLAARILTTVRAPSRGGGRWQLPLPVPRWDSSWRDTAQWVVAGVIGLAGVLLMLTPFAGRDAEVPPPTQPPPADAVQAVPEPAAGPQPATAPESGTAPESDAAPDSAAAPQHAAAAPESLTAPEPAGMPQRSAVPEPSADEQPADTAPPAALEPPATAPERQVPSLGRSLQVGAFRNAANARALAAKLSARFPDVRVVTVTRNGVRFHCVRLGGFADERALTARADELRAAGYASLRAPE